jgi:iron complex outermembrane receptor protein
MARPGWCKRVTMATVGVVRKATSRMLRAAAVGVSLAAMTVASAAPATAQQRRAIAISVPAGPLEQALLTLGRQAGLRLVFPTPLTKGKTTSGVAGEITPEAAVAALLAGTGLTYRFTAPGSVTIERPGVAAAYSQAGGQVSLDTIEVQGETAWGPVNGYVATRSASGSKTDTPLIETPQSISIVTRDQIRNTGARSIAESLNYTSGVVAQSPIFTRMVDDFTVRGFNVANGNLGTLRDGMKLQSNVYDGGQESYGLERVEVLKGAASVLYGQLGPGGVINAISKRPTPTRFGEVNLEYGSYQRRQISADLGGPLTADGQFSYRLTGLLRKSETNVDHVDDDKIYIAPALTWAPTAATSLTLLGYYQQIRTRFAPPMPYANTRFNQIPRDLFIGEPSYDRYDSDQYALGYLFEHNFTDALKLRHSLRYFHADVAWDYLSFGGLRPNGRTLNRGVSDRDETSTGFTTDTSLEVKFDTGGIKHTLVAGLDTYRRTYDSHRRSGTVGPLLDIYAPVYGTTFPTLGAVDNGTDTVGNQYGIYLQDQMKIADKWVLLLGGRHDWADSRTRSYANNRVTKFDDTAFTGRAGLVYLFDNGIAPYVSFSQSFQPQVQTDRFGNPFKPTEGEQYEAGIRYQPPGTNLLLSASVYDLTQKNMLTPDPVAPTAFSVQTGEVRSRGVELEAKASFDALNLAASYSYTDARVTKSNNPAELDQRVDLVPYHSFALWADYDLSGLGLKGFKLGGGVRYLSGANITGFAYDVPGRTIVDAMMSYDFAAVAPSLKGMVLQVSAKNLFDKQYITCSTPTGCRYGDPRTVSASLSYRW